MTAQKMSAQEIIAFIGNAEKKTNVKVTFEGEGGKARLPPLHRGTETR